MTVTSYQTVKLSRGKHVSPKEGACVMELASMLADEPFSDHPRSVCPIIGAFLRGYNDSIDDGRRQDLYEYAGKVVGSRATADIEMARCQRLNAWRMELRERQRRHRRLMFPWRRTWRVFDRETSAAECGQELGRRDRSVHREVLALIDKLIAIGRLDGGSPPALDKRETKAIARVERA